MTNAPRLLDQLVSLTGIRDLELLEFSLLKTLSSFIRPLGLTLIKLDIKNRVRMEIVYGDGTCTVRHEGITVADDVMDTFAQLAASGAREQRIQRADQLLTISTLYATRATRTYLVIVSAAELSRLDSHLVAGMLQIYRNFCLLLQDAQTDQLTGLANRKTFDESVNKVYELIPPDDAPYPNERRNGASPSYWLAMIDIDYFKSINDRFGHLYGDEVLILIANILKSVFREDDLIFRFGGEEFVLIIRCPEMEDCRHTLERLRKTIEARTFPQVGRVTVSIGATRLARQTFAVTLMDYADKALYHSKHNGRNQTTFFEDLLARGLAKIERVESGDIDLF